MTGNLIDYRLSDLDREVSSARNRRAETAGAVAQYVAPRLVELTRAAAVAICGEVGCPGSPRRPGGAR